MVDKTLQFADDTILLRLLQRQMKHNLEQFYQLKIVLVKIVCLFEGKIAKFLHPPFLLLIKIKLKLPSS